MAKWLIPLSLLIAYLTGAGSLTDFLASFGTAVQGMKSPVVAAESILDNAR